MPLMTRTSFLIILCFAIVFAVAAAVSGFFFVRALLKYLEMRKSDGQPSGSAEQERATKE
jgi:uncharacterized membrane protein YciS (DUF1049 family)